MTRSHGRWLAGALLGVAAVVVLWMAFRERAGHVTLADGREVALLGVTVGTNHSQVAGARWARPLVRVLPERFRPALKVAMLKQDSPEPSLMVWVGWKYAASNAPVQYASLLDDQGTEVRSHYNVRFHYGPGRDGVFGFFFTNYPRRAERIGVRFRSGSEDGNRPLADLWFRNPAPVKERDEKIWALPQWVTNRGCEFGLVSFAITNTHADRPPRGEVEFSVRRGGQPDPGWQLLRLELTDGTGNRTGPDLVSLPAPAGRVRASFREALWPSEVNYRIRAEFCSPSVVSPADAWEVSSTTLPTGDAHLRIPVGVVRGPFSITSVDLVRTFSGPAPPGALRPNLLLTVTALPPTPGHTVRVLAVTDDRGREVRVGPALGAPNGDIFCQLEVPEGAASIRIRGTVLRTDWLEFRASPQWRKGGGGTNSGSTGRGLDSVGGDRRGGDR